MRKIDKDILNHLKLSDLVFKPTDSSIPNSPNPTEKDYERFMVIKKEHGIIKLSKDITFSVEDPKATITLTDDELLNDSWWVLPVKNTDNLR